MKNFEIEIITKALHDEHHAIALNTKQTSKALGCSEITLKINRAKSQGMPYIKDGRSVKYSIFDIANYIVSNKVKVMS